VSTARGRRFEGGCTVVSSSCRPGPSARPRGIG